MIVNALQQQRRFFAEEIDAQCDLQTAALVDALATVQVLVRCGIGLPCEGRFDAIMVNAGVTHAEDAWLETPPPRASPRITRMPVPRAGLLLST